MREVLQTIGYVLAIIVVIVAVCVECRNYFKSSKEDEPTEAIVLIKFIFKPTAFGIMTVFAFKLISLLF